ncbi:hypothetical protein BDF14DRAFT_1843945 [Spinellus fusiger]|nr:hypothetical protein BDF14DRAFT_1843945 [Spinellus fusiger]
MNTILDIITELGGRLAMAQPKELAVGNIVRRFLKVIREVKHGEHETRRTEMKTSFSSTTLLGEDEEEGFDEDEEEEDEDEDEEDIGKISKSTSSASSQVGSLNDRSPTTTTNTNTNTKSSMFRLLANTGPKKDERKNNANLKPYIIQEINEEIIADLECIYNGIADQAIDHIHANEVIMTIGKSRTVEKFLRRAAEHRKFQVIVAETSPTYQGHAMAKALSAAGIDTTVIVDSAIFAAMPRVNKVVLSAHAVLANGGLVSVTGSHLLAAAAKHHATPVLVCTALYKLSPLFAYDADAFNVTVAPNSVLGFQQGSLVDTVAVSNPYYDYVAPGLVSLFVHNLGSAPPTYVYRLINDNYDPEDTTL